MKTPKLIEHNRATLKLLFVGALSLATILPLHLVRSVVSDRQNLQFAAHSAIASRWGGSQSISGLVALTHAPSRVKADSNQRAVAQWRASVPTDLVIQAEMTTQNRYLGIYEVPVYTTGVTIRGRLDWQRLSRLQPHGNLLLWLPLSDVRGVREISSLTLGSLEIPARPLTVHAATISGLQFTVPEENRQDLFEGTSADYRLEITLAGSDSLLFLPLAETSHITLDADWPDPEFVGQYLPTERTISGTGVHASWQLLGLNRPFGDQWDVTDMPFQQLNQAGFGMRLETPVDGYQRSERSMKYGVMFITLTFFTLFLFEVMTGHPLHPVPYILTGAALAVFYLVLLALSEFLAFAPAFALAAGLLVGIVTPYTGAVLGQRRRGYLAGTMLALTYILLYVLVTAQHASLLLGSLALLLAIAGLMYVTRDVDWYEY